MSFLTSSARVGSCFAIFLFVAACSTAKEDESPSRVSLMTYNIDSLPAEGAALTEKLRRVGRVIQDSTTGCPDVVMLEGIEHPWILARLREEDLDDCGYNFSKFTTQKNGHEVHLAFLSHYLIDKIIEHSGNLSATLLPQQGAHIQIHAFYGLMIVGGWQEEKNPPQIAELRKDFFLSEDLVHSASLDQGSVYDAKEKGWAFLEQIALKRSQFTEPECHVVKNDPDQLDGKRHPLAFSQSTKTFHGISSHLPILCSAEY